MTETDRFLPSDTVFALSSAPGRGGVAVIRLSGPCAFAAVTSLLNGPSLPPPRQAGLRHLFDPANGLMLDAALVLCFRAPASFTGEDCVELHVHGSRAVVDAVLDALGRVNGCRLALPGEFTRRAFENDKLDLTAAEAVADLIAAETEAQRLQALDQLGGGLSRLYEDFAGRLTTAVARIEADLEFPDEDLPGGVMQAELLGLRQLRHDLAAHLADARKGERLRDGLTVAIIGAPNAGTSSLLNALAARDVAIVSPQAGTTRDVIEVPLDLGGYPVILLDTAGLRETADSIETEGIRRAIQRAADADIKLALFDVATAQPDAATAAQVDDRAIVVLSKCDLADDTATAVALWKEKFPQALAIVSCETLTPRGLDGLLAALTKSVAAFFAHHDTPPPTRARHRATLEETAAHLDRALDLAASADALPELVAEDLRLALRALGGMTGRVHVEDLLDRIFRDFCIGK